MKRGKILIVDDNEDILFTLKMLLRPIAESITTLNDPRELLPIISRTRFDVILLDMNFRQDAVSGKEGFHWLEEILKLDAKAVVIFITAYADTEKAVQAIKQGATDFIPKPWQNEKLIATVSSALQVNGYKMPTSNLVVNMAPADIRKEGSAYDLPLAIGLLGASETISSEKLSRYLMMGELSLDGSIQPIKGALPIAIKAREENFEGLIIPQQNAREAAVVNQLKVYGVSNIKEVIQFFNGERELEQTVVNTREEFYQQQTAFDLDFADVKGQENVKRALEVAAAGGHNLIMIGAPGSGKSMMAKRLPSILPPLSLGESLETTKIHSVAGKLNRGSSLISQRPFRDPHHTISQVAMVGGGSFPQPGEISLAHNGVLFLDELPEFNRGVLEVLRQPLEDRQITISRIKSTISYPANLMLIASMNPCPCGYYNHPTKACVCSPGQVQKYLNKISGPLLDRIDIQIEIVPVPFDKISDQRQGEASSVIRNRVIQARRIQEQRYADHPGIYCNAQMSSKLLSIYARPDDKGLSLLRNAMERLNLSARAYDRILKVARTIADLEGAELIQPSHLAEAISYRNLDRENWAG